MPSCGEDCERDRAVTLRRLPESVAQPAPDDRENGILSRLSSAFDGPNSSLNPCVSPPPFHIAFACGVPAR